MSHQQLKSISPASFNKGDLVRTREGYYAIVLFQEGSEIGVMLCNGMACVEQADTVQECTIQDGPARANFNEIIGQDRWFDRRPHAELETGG